MFFGIIWVVVFLLFPYLALGFTLTDTTTSAELTIRVDSQNTVSGELAITFAKLPSATSPQRPFIILPFAIQKITYQKEYVQLISSPIGDHDNFSYIEIISSALNKVDISFLVETAVHDPALSPDLNQSNDFLLITSKTYTPDNLDYTLYFRFDTYPADRLFDDKSLAQLGRGMIVPLKTKVSFLGDVMPSKTNLFVAGSEGQYDPARNEYTIPTSFYQGTYLWIDYQLPLPKEGGINPDDIFDAILDIVFALGLGLSIILSLTDLAPKPFRFSIAAIIMALLPCVTLSIYLFRENELARYYKQNHTAVWTAAIAYLLCLVLLCYSWLKERRKETTLGTPASPSPTQPSHP